MAKSHGSGEYRPEQFARLGADTVLEAGVLVFHPENIEIGAGVYVGHQTILKGYYRNKMVIGDGVWIGQQCFLHSAGGIVIEANVGIGPGVKILTSAHQLDDATTPVLHAPLDFAAVRIEEGADLGAGCILLPGVTIGRRAQIGAGTVVAESIPELAVAAGVPARVLRIRS